MAASFAVFAFLVKKSMVLLQCPQTPIFAKEDANANLQCIDKAQNKAETRVCGFNAKCLLILMTGSSVATGLTHSILIIWFNKILTQTVQANISTCIF